MMEWPDRADSGIHIICSVLQPFFGFDKQAFVVQGVMLAFKAVDMQHHPFLAGHIAKPFSQLLRVFGVFGDQGFHPAAAGALALFQSGDFAAGGQDRPLGLPVIVKLE
ncbi:hypothetical protein D3C80_1269080 [compost metagenome]